MKQFKIRKGVYPVRGGTLEILVDLDSREPLSARSLKINGEHPSAGEVIPEEILYLLWRRLPVLEEIVQRLGKHLFDNFPVISIEEAETRAMRMIRECDLLLPLLWEGRTLPAGPSPRVSIGG